MAGVLYVLRLIHVLAGVGWFGEVVTVNVVLLPVLERASSEDRDRLLALVFPRVFRLATVLGGVAVGSGLILAGWYTRGHVAHVLGDAWGQRVLAGAALGGALYAFHLFQEGHLEHAFEARLRAAARAPGAERLLQRLIWIPRIGGGVLLLVIGLMVAAAHLP